MKHALFSFTNQDLIRFFESKGVKAVEDKNGKIFPASLRAADVLEALKSGLSSQVTILYGNPVLHVSREKDHFNVRTRNAVYSARILVISTGGMSYPSTGSTGDGYRFAKGLGHSLVETQPALSPVLIRNYGMAELAGISLSDTEIRLYRDERKIATNRGDLVFTHKGLSGPGIIDFSRYIRAGDTLRINFTESNAAELNLKLLEASKTSGKTSLQSWLRPHGIPRNLLHYLIRESGTDPDARIATLTRQSRLLLAEKLCNHPFVVEALAGYKSAMATAGGIRLSEVSPITMESTIVQNLFFAGEVLDIDGDTGGYNLQAAFSTAYNAAQAINLRR